MAVSIRLRREGAKNRPYYKVVVADSRSPRDGKFIELIGTYDPKKQGENSTLKVDRAEHWIATRRAAVGHGAQPVEEEQGPRGGRTGTGGSRTGRRIAPAFTGATCFGMSRTRGSASLRLDNA